MMYSRQQAFTFVELMIAMTIGLLIMAGSLRLYTLSRAVYQTTQNLADLEERAVFALRQLGEDILQAGYFGLHSDGRLLTPEAALSIYCSGHDVTPWAVHTSRAIGAGNAVADLPCAPRYPVVPDSDMLTLRFADNHRDGAAADELQIATGFSGGVITQHAHKESGTDVTAHKRLHVRTWYVASNSSEEMPALFRQTLRHDGRFENQEIMPGIEDFQVRLGIDSDADNFADTFINPPGAGLHPGKVAAVQVQLRLRSRFPEPGHANPQPWTSIDPENPPYAPADRLRRITVERTFPVHNPQAGHPR